MIVAGILSPIEQPLTWLLETLHADLGLPWAWSVIALTLIVRVLLVPISVKQIHSMQRLQRYAPALKELQKKYKNDKQKLREEQMKFFQEHQVNPAASCLPIVFQIPIFFALYFVLRDFDEEIFPEYERQGETHGDLGWLGFVPDMTVNISEHWSGFLLIAVYVASQVSSAYFMSMTADRTQRILFLVLPFVLVPFIIDPPGGTVFPVGLLLYWVTTNLWTVGQGLVTRRLVPRGTLTTTKRSSRTPPREKAAAKPEPAQAVGPPAPAQADGSARRVKRKKKKRTRR
jgi:YidC/Oxa1 family membrane protein insertase